MQLQKLQLLQLRIKTDNPLSFENMAISEEIMNHSFDFTVHKDMESNKEMECSQLQSTWGCSYQGKCQKNKFLCTTLREVLNVPELAFLMTI